MVPNEDITPGYYWARRLDEDGLYFDWMPVEVVNWKFPADWNHKETQELLVLSRHTDTDHRMLRYDGLARPNSWEFHSRIEKPKWDAK